MAVSISTLALAKKYTNKVGSTIQGTSYDYDTGKLTFNTADGDWSVSVNNGMNTVYKQTLDNVEFDAADSTLKVNGQTVVTQEDVATEDIDFSNMF
jgi:hypothetical protein